MEQERSKSISRETFKLDFEDKIEDFDNLFAILFFMVSMNIMLIHI